MVIVMSEEVLRVPRGLEDVFVDTSSISVTDPEGKLYYRGYSIDEIIAKTTFEGAAYLILYGKPPTLDELKVFTKRVQSKREVPRELYDIFTRLPAKSTHPMDILRIGVSILGAFNPAAEDLSEPSLIEKGIDIIGKMGTILANGYRIVYEKKSPVKPDETISYAENLLYMLKEKKPDPTSISALDKALTCYIDHEFNTSTFTVRVTASTLADMYSAISAGVSSLKGPLHGGANEKAMEMLLKIGDVSNTDAYVRSALQRGEKLMGFGHRVYKIVDPRTPILKKVLDGIVREHPQYVKWRDIAGKAEEVMWKERKIPPNVDFYMAPIFYSLGIPIPLDTPLFAAARSVGWVAHYIEQIKDNKLIRPRAEYTGSRGLKFP